MEPKDRPRDLISTATFADIAFLLLIFFLLSATLATRRGLDFDLDPQEVSVEPRRAVLVEVLAGGGLRVDGRLYDRGALLGYLGQRWSIDAERPVIVLPAPDARYGEAVEVLDLVRQGKTLLGLAGTVDMALPTAREAALWHRG